MYNKFYILGAHLYIIMRLVNTKPIYMVLFLLFFISACSNKDESFDETFAKEYNIQVENMNQLLLEHDGLVNRINADLSSPARNYGNMKDYITWVEINRVKIQSFKLYIETNYNSLKKLEINPDYARDNIIRNLDVMQQNEVRFRTVIALQDNLS